MQTTKPCTKCGIEKPFSDFRKQKGKKFGLRYDCIECQDKIAKERYQKQRERILIQVKEYQAKLKQNPPQEEEDDFLK